MTGQSNIPDAAQTMAPATLQIRLEQTMQIFNTLDPYPFVGRDLDPAAEDYLVTWAQEVPQGQPLRIEVLVPREEAAKPEALQLPRAVQSYFTNRVAVVSRELKQLFRIGRTALLIGIVMLGLCLLLAQTLTTLYHDNGFISVLGEGLVIAGWVANWRPIEIFLYDWWPLVRQRRLFHRLANAQMEVIAERASPPVPS